jgi:hypothetical protein
MKKRLITLFVFGLLGLVTSFTCAQEPGWSGPILATGPTRARIESTPIERRSYRPFHFYGNTIRRRHYRGTAVPLPRDLVQGAGALVRPVQ